MRHPLEEEKQKAGVGRVGSAWRSAMGGRVDRQKDRYTYICIHVLKRKWYTHIYIYLEAVPLNRQSLWPRLFFFGRFRSLSSARLETDGEKRKEKIDEERRQPRSQPVTIPILHRQSRVVVVPCRLCFPKAAGCPTRRSLIGSKRRAPLCPARHSRRAQLAQGLEARRGDGMDQ